MCVNDHFIAGNQARRTHGVRAFETTGRLPDVVRQTVEDFREAVIADRGGASELSTLELASPVWSPVGDLMMNAAADADGFQAARRMLY
jgi:hypothetical protein